MYSLKISKILLNQARKKPISNASTQRSTKFWSKMSKNPVSNRYKFKTPKNLHVNVPKPSPKTKQAASSTAACTFQSGVFLLFIFHPLCFLAAKCGLADRPIKYIESFEYGKKVVASTRETIREQVSNIRKYSDKITIEDKTFEHVGIGLLLYFCLKPVRYSLWAKLTHRCWKAKQAGLANNKAVQGQGQIASSSSRRKIEAIKNIPRLRHKSFKESESLKSIRRQFDRFRR